MSLEVLGLGHNPVSDGRFPVNYRPFSCSVDGAVEESVWSEGLGGWLHVVGHDCGHHLNTLHLQEEIKDWVREYSAHVEDFAANHCYISLTIFY